MTGHDTSSPPTGFLKSMIARVRAYAEAHPAAGCTDLAKNSSSA
jgi:hypothetical protein